MASAESGSVPSGVVYGEGCPLSSRLRSLGERRELPQRGVRAENGFWRILKATAHFCTYAKICMGRGTICIRDPAPNSGGLSPLSSVIYAHVREGGAEFSLGLPGAAALHYHTHCPKISFQRDEEQ